MRTDPQPDISLTLERESEQHPRGFWSCQEESLYFYPFRTSKPAIGSRVFSDFHTLFVLKKVPTKTFGVPTAELFVSHKAELSDNEINYLGEDI